ncbi:NUDIX domain-containing protein [Candidatus Woesearchaeota archaeon]|nr:NUDIX domain-containing protein [Candidatus Woesearchaeota archaeon]
MRNGPIVIVRAVLEDLDRRILLLEKSPGRFELPGGKVKYRETLDEACFREIRKETGFILEAFECFLFNEHIPKNGGNNHHITFYYAALVYGKARISNESIGFRWLDFPYNFEGINLAFDEQKAVIEYMSRFKI